jgi:hypothetical protein
MLGWTKVQLVAPATSATLSARTRRRNDVEVPGADRVTQMQVTAISTPRYPQWRWRITGYGGETVEESQIGFPTIAAAVAAGRERLVSMNVPDPTPSVPRAWPSRFGRR